MLTDVGIARIKERAKAPARSLAGYSVAARADVDALLADRDELVRRLAKVEAAAQVFFASDSWCVGLRDHVSAKACPCGYAQLRAAFGPAAPMEDTP